MCLFNVAGQIVCRTVVPIPPIPFGFIMVSPVESTRKKTSEVCVRSHMQTQLNSYQ